MAWFNAEKGFGFLTADSGAAVFVDYRVIEVPGYKNLTAAQPVVFTATDTGRGPEATRVIPYTRTTPTPNWRFHGVTGGGARRGRRCRRPHAS